MKPNEGHGLNGAFVSYARQDMDVAKRICKGLASLGVSVHWDQSMAAVDWQRHLAQAIADIPVIIVLWTDNSAKSDSVWDEARLALDERKLINLLYGVEKPPHPFDRINGLPMNDWVDGKDHDQWERLIDAIDKRLVATEAVERDRRIIDVLKGQLSDLERRRIELADLKLLEISLSDEYETAVGDVACAEEELSTAEAQLRKVKEVTVARPILETALQLVETTKENLAESREKARNAKLRHSSTLTSIKKEREKLIAYVKNIGMNPEIIESDYLTSSAPPPTPQPPPAPLSLPPVVPETSPPPAPPEGPQPKGLRRKVLAAVSVATVITIGVFFIDRGFLVPARTNPDIDWIIGSWGIGKPGKVCSEVTTIQLSENDRKLLFSSRKSRQSVDFEVKSSNPRVIVTETYKYIDIGDNKIRVESGGDFIQELARCK